MSVVRKKVPKPIYVNWNPDLLARLLSTSTCGVVSCNKDFPLDGGPRPVLRFGVDNQYFIYQNCPDYPESRGLRCGDQDELYIEEQDRVTLTDAKCYSELYHKLKILGYELEATPEEVTTCLHESH